MADQTGTTTSTKQLAIGLGAFAAGVAAWIIGTGRYGDRLAALVHRPVDLDAGSGAVPGDSTTSPIDPRPATMTAAPVGMAETEKHFREGPFNPAAEHIPTDLLADHQPGPTDRAPDAFRPDPTAVPTAEERESLRPATGPAPTLVADRGSGFSEAAGAS